MEAGEKVRITDVTPGTTPPPSDGLILAIRTDASHAMYSLRRNIVASLQQDAVQAAFGPASKEVARPDHESQTRQVLHRNYQSWGRKVLAAFADCLDYAQYGITDPARQKLDIHFYNAAALADDAVSKGIGHVQKAKGPAPLLLTLDDMIEPKLQQNWGEIAFSRLFSADGKQQLDYVGRPGRPPLPKQIDLVRQHVGALARAAQEPVPIILVEDNVRHAKMLNWVIGKLHDGGVFEHGRPAAITTCFSMANEAERAAIRYQGAQIPVVASVDYQSAKVDVITPRDLLFDGLVVQTGKDSMGRLPGVFLDEASLVSRFKIRPDKTEEFLHRTRQANMAFCYNVEREIGKDLPLGWFAGSDPISRLTGEPPERPMHVVMQRARNGRSVNPISQPTDS